VSTEWITAVSWDDSTVSVDLSTQGVRNAPEYDPSRPLARAEEQRLYEHHRRPGYWERPEEAWRRRSR
jgi:hypothetical protein